MAKAKEKRKEFQNCAFRSLFSRSLANGESAPACIPIYSKSVCTKRADCVQSSNGELLISTPSVYDVYIDCILEVVEGIRSYTHTLCRETVELFIVFHMVLCV